MSKWGFVSKSTAKTKFENRPDEAFGMVEDMSHHILGQEKEVKALDMRIQDLQTQIIANGTDIGELNRQVGRLEGYRDRVQETDKHTGKKKGA